MDLRSLLQDVLSEVSSKIISFQIELHLLNTWGKSSNYFRLIETLRCIMASQSTGNLKILKIRICTLGLRSSKVFVLDVICMGLFHMWYTWVSFWIVPYLRSEKNQAVQPSTYKKLLQFPVKRKPASWRFCTDIASIEKSWVFF